jgi:drug/metabolite transporter (DMT)-like permease
MSNQLKGVLLALVGVVVLSPDSLLVRLSSLEQWTMQFYRGVGMFSCLSLAMLVIYRRNVITAFRSVGVRGVVAGACFAIASMLFVSSLYYTSVANSLAIISSSPLFGAIFSRFALKEHIPTRTWAAIVLCIGAITIIMCWDMEASADTIFGDFLALGHAVFIATSFVLIRSRAQVNMVPCIALSGLFQALVSLPLAGTLALTVQQAPPLALLVVVVLPLAFSLLLLAPRYIPAPEVNMIMLMEMLLGPLLVWLVIGENIPAGTYVGGGLLFTVLLGHSYLTLRSKTRSRREEAETRLG